MSHDAATYLARLRALDHAMVAAGLPPISERWWSAIERFAHSGRRQIVVRKGRRAGASTIVAPRVIAASMLYLPHQIPASDLGVFGCVSVRRDEASARLRGIALVFDSLGVAYDRTADTIALRDRPIQARVLTASFRVEVGQTLIGLWADEVSRWRDDSAGANPASEIMATLRPAMATQRHARTWLISSPLAGDDFHATSFDAGDTDYQIVESGPTWAWNPTLPEAQCRALEPDERIFRREYMAEPQASVSAAFDAAGVEACFRALPGPDDGTWYRPIGVLDSAAGKSQRSDSMTWATCSYYEPRAPEPFLRGLVPRIASVANIKREQLPESVRHYWRPGEFSYPDPHDLIPGILKDAAGVPLRNPAAERPAVPLLCVTSIDGVSGVFGGGLVTGSLWERVRRFFLSAGVTDVICDTYGANQTERELAHTSRYALRVHPVAWTAELKARSVYRLRQLMSDRALVIREHDAMRRELLAYTERVSPSGTVSYSARGSGKDDHAALLINAVIGEELRLLPGSDRFAPNTRTAVEGRG